MPLSDSADRAGLADRAGSADPAGLADRAGPTVAAPTRQQAPSIPAPRRGADDPPAPPAPSGPAVVRARTAVAVVFSLNGFGIAAWFARVPAARDALELSAGRLGLLLLAVSTGSLLALLTAGVVAQRIGTARAVAAGTTLLAVGLAATGAGAGLWGSVPAVVIGLFALGCGAGTCEVAMNVQAAAVERRLRRTIMPRFHAAWSLGTVVGALAGAGVTRIGLSVALHLLGAAAIGLAGTLVAVRRFLPDAPSGAVGPSAAGETPDDRPDPARDAGDARNGRGRPRGGGVLAAWREPRTLLIGALVLVLAFTEGTANDWLAVSFIDGHGVGEAAGAAAFGVFVAAMTLGRTFGTLALDRWGRVPVLLVTMLLAAGGVAVTVLAQWWPLAIGGVALWGLGTALGFPVGMSAAADDERHAAARVSVVAAIGYTAFLAGPPLVGLLGDRVGTLRALLVVPLLLLPALLLVPTTAKPRPGVRSSSPCDAEAPMEATAPHKT